jgi:hypothetical protein
MPTAIIMEILGHCSSDVTDKYTHIGDAATLTAAINRFGFSIEGDESDSELLPAILRDIPDEPR